MSYVPRRIQTIKKDGKTETISDQEFSAFEAASVRWLPDLFSRTATLRFISNLSCCGNTT
jgi:hypothetical protein